MFTIKKGFGLSLALAAMLGMQGTAQAATGSSGAKCADPTVAQPAAGQKSNVWKAFAAFGDIADYFVAPGGDFESGASGWTLTNSRVVRGNETAGIMGGSHSLELGAGLLSDAAAVSPAFCVTDEHPTFRYVMRPKGLVGVLSTFVRYKAADGSTQEEQIHSRSRVTLLPGRWSPSTLQPLATKLPMARIGGVATVQLVFRAPINLLGGGYRIDAVMVDPYRTR